MIGTITLNPSIDRHVMVPQLVKDDANRATEIFETAGGKGINVSKVVRELGGQTRAYALLGGFAGDYLRHLTKPLDFPLIAVSVRGNTRINTVISDRKDGTQTRISAPGPRISQTEVRRLTRMLLSARPRPKLWALGGSISTGMKATVYRDLIHALQKERTSCILDTDDDALKYGVEAGPYMIKPNEFEIGRLCGKNVDTIPEYMTAAHSLLRLGVSIVIVSMAAKGALFVTKNEAFHATTPKVSVKSHVGAGDSLIGGVALGLARQMSLKDAAKLGIAASTSAVMREAPRLCLKQDIRGLLRRVKIKDL